MADPHDLEEAETIAEVRRDLIRRSLVNMFGDAPPTLGQVPSLLEATTKAAANFAEKEGMELYEFDCGGPGDTATLIVEKLRRAIEYKGDGEDLVGLTNDLRKALIWHHHNSLLDEVRSKKVPKFDRVEIEGAVSDYLNEPWRCEELDRLFIDLLVAIELVAFADTILNEPRWFPNALRFSPLRKKHPLRVFLGEVLLEWVVAGALLAGLFWLVEGDWLNDGLALGLGGALLAIMVLWQAYMLIQLPFGWRRHNQSKERVVSMIDSMYFVYSELKSDGPISARHIEQRLNYVSQDGVQWPAPVFALLDDINRRSGRF